MYSEVGEVRELGKDWVIFNIKDLEKTYTKIKGINEAKKMEIQMHTSRHGDIVIKVKFLTNYRFESSKGCQESAFKTL